MSLIKRNPYKLFDELERSMMNRMRSMLLPFDDDMVQPFDANMMAVDMSSDEKSITVRTELPGFTEDEINVDVRGNVLNISAESKKEHEDQNENWHIREMHYGKYARSIVLPEEVVIDKADATLENGILTVKLPKQTPGPIQKIAAKAKNLLTGKKQDK